MTDMDRIKKGLSAFVRAQFPKIDYLGQYPAKVVKQNDDLTLELMVDDPRMPPLSGIVLRTFAPGITIRVEPEARVLVMFENGDPSKPVATLFDTSAGSLAELDVGAATIKLGSAATDALVMGTTYRQADAAFDSAIQTATTALSTACTTFASGMAPLLANPSPQFVDLKTLIGLLGPLGVAIGTAATALGAAAQTKEANPTSYLSTVSSTG